MNVFRRCVIKELLVAAPSGKVVYVTSDSHCVFVLSGFTSDVIEGIWVQLVLNLTKRKMINGILDVPMMLQYDHAIIWVKDFQIICFPKSAAEDLSSLLLPRPSLPQAMTLAIGGPTGAGKTTLIRRLLASPIGERIMRYVAYTTRPPRSHEINGFDYHFVKPEDMSFYQNNKRFTGFVEARGYWYWTDPLKFFKARWSMPQAIYVFSITQVDEFLVRREIAPDLQWIWLEVSHEVLRQRLEKRGDQNINESLAHSERLERQDRTGLVNLCLNTEVEDIGTSLRRLLEFLGEAQEEEL